MSATALDATLRELEGRLAHPPGAGSFDEAELEGLPDPACRYLSTVGCLVGHPRSRLPTQFGTEPGR
jgi:hypothetical protein